MKIIFCLGEERNKNGQGIGDESHKTSLSRIIVGDEKRVRVVDGALKGYVGNIVKVNLLKGRQS